MAVLGLDAPVVIDGGMATRLEARGRAMHPTLWSGGAVITAPHEVTAVHQEFFDAGAEIAITASYQLSPQALRVLGYNSEKIRDLLLKTIELAQAASRGEPRERIAASIGPYGAYLCDGSEYSGRYSIGREDLREFHRERFAIFESSACDVVLFETIPCLDEVHAIADLCQPSTKPVWVSLCCRSGTELASGEPLAAAVEIVDALPSVAVVGVNCVSPRFVAEHVSLLRRATNKPICVYPNLGQTWDAARRTWTGAFDAATFLAFVDEWITLGVDGVGGCCGVGPELIRAIAQRVRTARM